MARFHQPQLMFGLIISRFPHFASPGMIRASSELAAFPLVTASSSSSITTGASSPILDVPVGAVPPLDVTGPIISAPSILDTVAPAPVTLSASQSSVATLMPLITTAVMPLTSAPASAVATTSPPLEPVPVLTVPPVPAPIAPTSLVLPTGVVGLTSGTSPGMCASRIARANRRSLADVTDSTSQPTKQVFTAPRESWTESALPTVTTYWVETISTLHGGKLYTTWVEVIYTNHFEQPTTGPTPKQGSIGFGTIKESAGGVRHTNAAGREAPSTGTVTKSSGMRSLKALKSLLIIVLLPFVWCII